MIATHPLRNLLVPLTALLILLLLGLPMAQAAELAQVGTLTIQQQIEPVRQLVTGGDPFSYVIQLRNNGGTAPLQVEFRNALDSSLRLVDQIALEETNFRTRVDYERDAAGRPRQVISGRVTLAPDASVTLRVPVQVHTGCSVAGTSETLINTVVANTTEGVNARSALNVTRTCPASLLDQVEVSMVAVCTQTLDEPLGIQAGQCGNQIGKQIVLTNNAEQQVILGYRLVWQYIGETEKNLASESIVLRPGETRTLEVWTDMRPLARLFTDFDAGLLAEGAASSAELIVDFGLFHTILTDLEERPRIDPAYPNVARQTLTVPFRAWNFGDAPTSNNNAGVPMAAYPGVRANFPTVYDSTARVTGPAHARPRHFHLGQGVSVAPNADLGARPNLHPPSNLANQALFDDGARPESWQLNHCESTTVDVRIFISAHAADWFARNNLRGYLNGWIDGNRDGDWADGIDCAGGNRALEHFIIDVGVDVARLGAGYHTLRVPTGAVPWPAAQAQQPTWVRLTLSEQPAVKIGTSNGVQFGDGRGPTQPFSTGETEDYFLRPRGSAGSGPDLAVRLNGNWHPVPEQPNKAANLAFTFQKIEWTLRADYTNLGNERAENAILTFDMPPGVRGQDARITLPPELRRDAITVSDERIVLNLGHIEPGQQGRLILGYVEDIDPEIHRFRASIACCGSSDTNSANNTAEWNLEAQNTAPPSFGFRSPTMDFNVQRGTTNSSTLILEGQVPGLLLPAVQRVWVQQVMVGMGQKDAYVVDPLEPFQIPLAADGSWNLTLSDLPDGVYQFAVGDQTACAQSLRTLGGNDNEWRRSLYGFGVVCGLAVVNSRLPIDPISMRFVEVPTDAAQTLNASTYLPDTLDWAQGAWRLRIFDTNPEDGTTRHRVMLNGRPDAEVFLSFTGFGTFEVKLTEVRPGRYETSFIMGDGGSIPNIAAMTREISLRVQIADREVQYTGELIIETPGQVRDTRSGAALPSVALTVLAAARSGDDVILAPRSAPAVTDRNGVYRLSDARSIDQIYVTAEGYQPYRAAVADRDGLLNPTIRLSRTIAAPPDLVVTLTERGFEPALLRVAPGQVIEFVNSSDQAYGVASDTWDSGLLLTGERYTIRAERAGTITIRDATDPTRSGTIVVAAPTSDQYTVYLPLTRR